MKVEGRKLELWNRFVRTATWLAPADAVTALVWVELFAEFESDPRGMIAGRIAQLRAAATEIGLGGPGSRTRFGLDVGNKQADPAEQFFG